MKRLTASGLWRNFMCIASAVLPRAGHTDEWAARGTGIHAFLADVNTIGRAAALAKIEDEELAAACAMINVERLPVDRAKYASEVAFAFSVRTGKARELGRDISRDYSSASDDEICGSADIVALVGDDAVFVGDIKTGFKHLRAPADNWQFKFLGLAAARAYGRSRAIVELIRIGSDGEPYRVGGELDLLDLASISEELRVLHADVARAAAADVEPPATTGAHCSGCPSISFCKAATALIRAPGDGWAEVTAEHALAAYEQREAVRAVLAKMDEQLDDFAAAHPFPLRDGRWYGAIDKSRESLEGAQVWALINERYGADEAWKVTQISATKKAIEDLAARVVAKSGGKKTHVTRELLDALRERKAIRTKFFQSVGAYKPKELKP